MMQKTLCICRQYGRMKNSIPFDFVLFLFVIQFFSSCEKDNLNGGIIEGQQFVSALYSNAVDTLFLAPNCYFAETQLYRNFFPGGPWRRKSPLTASIFMVNVDSLPIPPNLTITEIYVIKDQMAWISKPGAPGPDSYPDYKLNSVSTNGPAWETGIKVDVILKIVDNSNQKEYFLRAKDQEIQRIE
jgi:hypothetical protein